MDYDKTEKLLAGIASILAVIGAGIKWYLPYRQSTRQKQSMVQGLKTLHAVYSAMERLQDHGATRVIVFGGHNSGGIPRPGSPFYCTALHWIVSDAYVDRVGDYTELQVDAHYIGMLVELEKTGTYRFDMAGENGSMLKKYYTAEGILDSFLFYLACMDNTFLYMSVCSHTRKFTDNEITMIGLICQGISKEIKS